MKIETKEYFDLVAHQRDYWRKKNSYYHEDIIRLLHFLIPPHASVLEVGCATGDVLNSLESRKGMGIDFSKEMILNAQRKYPHVRFQTMSLEELVLDETFGYVVLSDIVGFLHDIQHGFEKLHGVCHSQTKIIITYYNYLWEPLLVLAEKMHLKMKQPISNWLAKTDFEHVLRLAGFEIVKKGERLLLPKYIPLVSSFCNRFLAKLPLIRRLCLVNYLVVRPLPVGKGVERSVTVVVPARNEKGNIEDIVRRLPQLGLHTELIFVEGNSSDGTREEMHRVARAYPDRDIKIFVQDGKGKGDAVRKGFDHAQGDILMILDADMTVEPEELPKFYQALVSGSGEFINGSRLVYPLEDQSMRVLNILGNKFFSLMFSWLLDQRLKDTLCGTKVLWKKDYEQIKSNRSFFGDFDPFGDFDLLFGAAKLNLKIIDLPIRYKARSYGTTNINRFSHGWLLLKMCVFAMKKIKFI